MSRNPKFIFQEWDGEIKESFIEIMAQMTADYFRKKQNDDQHKSKDGTEAELSITESGGLSV